MLQPEASEGQKLQDTINKFSPMSFLKSIPNKAMAMANKVKGKKLEKKHALLEKRVAELDKMEQGGSGNIEKAREEALGKVYAMMESMGVDPSNIESVRGFMAQLEEEDPDLAELFTNAFDKLLPPVSETAPVGQEQQPVDTQMLSELSANLQKGIPPQQ